MKDVSRYGRVGVVAAGEAEQIFDAPGIAPVILLLHEEPGRGDGADDDGVGEEWASVIAAEAKADDAGIAKIGELIPGCIGIAVIHDDDAKVAICLGEKAFNGTPDVALPCIVGNASGNGGFEARHFVLPKIKMNSEDCFPSVMDRRFLVICQLSKCVADSEALDEGRKAYGQTFFEQPAALPYIVYR